MPRNLTPTLSLLRLTALSIYFLTILPVCAQSRDSALPATSQSQPVIRSNSRLVMLDVVVTDKAGNPVTNLTKDDFRVLEDSEPQQIANFETPAEHLNLVPAPAADSASPAAKKGTVKPLTSSRAETILVLDELNTASVDMSFGWQSLLKYLRKQPAKLENPTAIMVLTKRRLIKVADPSQNTAQLIAKAKKIELELPSHSMEGGVQSAATLMLTSLLALDEIALSSADRQTRKNVIWIGTGFPVLSVYNVDLADRDRFLGYIRYTANWMQETRTTIYTVDPKGLPIVEPDYISDLGSTGVGQDFGSATSELIFESLAPATGGKIYRYRNDVDVALADAAENGATYYTLSYYPENSDFDGKFRKIQVQIVDQPKLSAATQQGYYAIDEGFGASKSELDFALSRAVTSPLPFASVQFDAVGKVLLAPPPTARFSVSVDRDTISWDQQPNGDQRTEITVVYAEMSGKSAVLGYKVKEMEIVIPKAQFANSPNHRILFNVNVPLPPKTDHLRFVVRDAATGRLGTYDAPRQGLGQQLAASNK
ncbi:MAG TPA: VWA domain-containing protein [Candidatus Acidoferrum sp.]|nr:VWA domain-containing protein [Candidatus Acidoferrum sp.]